MEEIYKTSLLLIHSIAQLDGVCNLFKDTPTVENVDKIAEIVDKCEEKFLKVKETIVTMVSKVEASELRPVERDIEIPAIETAGGFLISDKE